MSQKYCTNCGKPHPITVNFCEVCGNAFASAKTAKIPVAPVNTSVSTTNDEDDDDDFDDSPTPKSVPQIEKLEVVTRPVRTNRLTISEIAGTGSQRRDDTPAKKVKVNTKQVLKEFKKEAGTLRND